MPRHTWIPFHSNFRQSSNNQSADKIVTTNIQKLTRTVISNGYTQSVASNHQQLGIPSNNQQIGNSSSWQQPPVSYSPWNNQRSNAVLSTTTNHPFNHTTNVALDIVNSAAQPTDPRNDTTFFISTEPPLLNSSNVSNNYQPLSSRYQPQISSQLPIVVSSQQPIMSSYQQPGHGQGSSQPSAVAYQQYTPNPMYQPIYQNPNASSMNQHSFYVNQPVSSASVQQPNSIAQSNSTNRSTVPVANYQQNQSFNSTVQMNPSYASNYMALGGSPNHQIVQLSRIYLYSTVNRKNGKRSSAHTTIQPLYVATTIMKILVVYRKL